METKSNSLSAYNLAVENHFAKCAIEVKCSLPAKVLKIKLSTFEETLNNQGFLNSLYPFIEFIDE